MEAVSLNNLAIVCAVAFAAPLMLGFAPWLRAPSVLIEILAGVVLGPSLLGWVEADTAVQVLSLIGVGYLLLLAGLEIDFDQLRGAVLRVALLGFVLSFALALVVAYMLRGAGVISSPFLIAVILSATSLAELEQFGLISAGPGGYFDADAVHVAGTAADIANSLLLRRTWSAYRARNHLTGVVAGAPLSLIMNTTNFAGAESLALRETAWMSFGDS